MSETASFYGRVIGGKVKLLNREGFDRYIQAMDGLEIDVLVRKHRKARSLNQNRFYWGVAIAMISEATGYEPEEAHDALKAMFLTDHVDSALPRIRSSADLSTVEFNEYIEKIQRFAAEKLDLIIPDPE